MLAKYKLHGLPIQFCAAYFCVALDDAEKERTAEGVGGLRSHSTAQLLASKQPGTVNDA